MTTALSILLLILAAMLEVGGDALIRVGLRRSAVIWMIGGGIVLFVYGLAVNLPKWNFSRLMGVYIALFFVVSQIAAVLFFREKIAPPMLVAGALIVSGGVVLTVWHTQ
jgi:small multidrug resistance family-3 protein